MTLHHKFGFFSWSPRSSAGLLALISLVTPFVGVVLKIYLRLLLLAVAIQIVLGGALYLMGDRPTHELHYLYGAGMAVTLGSHLRGQPANAVATLEAPAR